MTDTLKSRASSRRQRLILIGLDGYEQTVADRLFALGELPNLRAMLDEGASIDLDHGRDKLSGLSWEQFATGCGPRDSGRWTAVDFNPKTYVASQRLTTDLPFLKQAGDRAVVLDAPYFDLGRCEGVRGFVNWGAHDPGVAPFCRPAGLVEDMEARFGAYAAPKDIYAFCWPDPDAARGAGERLTRALKQRADITCWALAEQFHDWDVALTVVSELHSAIEPLWHGVDENHPLHDSPSAAPARQGLFDIYRALDDMIAQIKARFPEDAVALFWMHGMGVNDADVASMILLPELLYRDAFGNANFEAPARWRGNAWPPMLEAGERWEASIFAAMKRNEPSKAPLIDRLAARASRSVDAMTGRRPKGEFALNWMPAQGYGFAWRRMRAFALPAFYDGRIRLNVAGREAHGLVAQKDYGRELDRIETMLHECRDVATGEAVVAETHRASEDPMAVPTSNGDLEVVWSGVSLGIDHPRLGKIGPAPYRRTGGHTGGLGRLVLQADGARSGRHGLAKSMDVPATIEDWLGLQADGPRSGRSFLARIYGENAAGYDASRKDRVTADEAGSHAAWEKLDT